MRVHRPRSHLAPRASISASSTLSYRKRLNCIGLPRGKQSSARQQCRRCYVHPKKAEVALASLWEGGGARSVTEGECGSEATEDATPVQSMLIRMLPHLFFKPHLFTNCSISATIKTCYSYKKGTDYEKEKTRPIRAYVVACDITHGLRFLR